MWYYYMVKETEYFFSLVFSNLFSYLYVLLSKQRYMNHMLALIFLKGLNLNPVKN